MFNGMQDSVVEYVFWIGFNYDWVGYFICFIYCIFDDCIVFDIVMFSIVWVSRCFSCGMFVILCYCWSSCKVYCCYCCCYK